MVLYTRPQLTLLLLVLGATCLGLAVASWRAAYPHLVERLESLDRDSPVPTAPSPALAVGAARPPLAERVRSHTPRRPPKRVEESAERAEPPIDVNRASAEELVRLPGIGPVLAARIVEARESGGAFASLDDLRRVRGLGPSKLERLRPRAMVGP